MTPFDTLLLAVPLLSFGASWLGTMVANKTDIQWIKSEVRELKGRVSEAHQRIDALLGRH